MKFDVTTDEFKADVARKQKTWYSHWWMKQKHGNNGLYVGHLKEVQHANL